MDQETGWYYLQSRYYDPGVGRFLNADGYFDTETGLVGTNMFAYSTNNPANRIDPTGYVSYKNTIRDNYYVTTVIIFKSTKITVTYVIGETGIRFRYPENNYWGILRRGGSRTLAKAMYNAAKSINKNMLSGRTISGLNTELKLHYVAYKLKIKHTSTGTAVKSSGMGSSWYGYRDYDSNAWFFESANAAWIVSTINIFKLNQAFALISSIAWYL